jgi:ABC-type nitrate/sulfonate/bicarbonate transport system substrate-binding protein
MTASPRHCRRSRRPLPWALAFVIAALLALAACGDPETADPLPAADDSGAGQVASGDRTTITLAVPDTPGHRSALYAVERHLVTSPSLDVVVNFIPPSTTSDAARSKQYDVVEVSALAVPAAAEEDLEVVMLVPGLIDVDGTLLFVSTIGGPTSAKELAGGTIGVGPGSDVAALQTRWLLHQKDGVRSTAEAGSLTVEEAPAASLPNLLTRGEVDAAVFPPEQAHAALDNSAFRVLRHVGAEISEMHGRPAPQTILVTYDDVASDRPGALDELQALLDASVAYFDANRDAVIEAIAGEQPGVSEDYLSWWWDAYDISYGKMSPDAQRSILALWEAARELGDIEDYPPIASVLFGAQPTPTPTAPAADDAD